MQRLVLSSGVLGLALSLVVSLGVLAGGLLAGCGGGDPPGVVQEAVVEGRVFSADKLKPLNTVAVTTDDGKQVLTDVDGRFSLTLSAASKTLGVDASTHAQTSKPVNHQAGAARAYVELVVMPFEISQSLVAEVGGSVKASSGAGVKIPPGALHTPDDAPVTGDAEVSVAAVNPKDPGQVRALPGTFRARHQDGREGLLVLVAAIDVTAKKGADRITVGGSMEAEITLPVFDRAVEQQTTLWSYDTQTDRWKQEGTADLTRDEDGRRVYRGKISHLSWWATGTFIDSETCVRGCVAQDSTPRDAGTDGAAGVTVAIRGVDHVFDVNVLTDSSGCFAADVKASADIVLQALSRTGASSVVSAPTPSTPMRVQDDHTACADLGTLTLVALSSSNVSCPSGWQQCGDFGCFDINGDANHCGACATVCTASAGLEAAACVQGVCGCARGMTACPGTTAAERCVDTTLDANHCGSCGNACATGQACVAGTCTALSCATGLTECGDLCVDLSGGGQNGMCPAACVPTTEICNGRDDNCDGMIDVGIALGACGTNVGQCTAGVESCVGGVLSCVPMVGPSAELCDGLDNDCDGMVDEGDPGGGGACGLAVGQCVSGVLSCVNGAFRCNGGVSPIVEVCDGLDNDCDGMFDEGNPGGGAACGNTVGECSAGALQCQGGSFVCVGAVSPIVEVCDGLDNDCDGNFDEGNPGGGGACGNNIGVCSIGSLTCSAGSLMCVGGVSPSAEVCDGLDNDCDGNFDEGNPGGGGACGVNGGACSGGAQQCLAGLMQCVGAVGPGSEICNGVDDDCDGILDNGYNLTTDVNNCGGCGVVCGAANAISACSAAICTIAQCNPGHFDLDGVSANGCEYACTASPEVCDGVDNDCDGIADNNLGAAPASTCLALGVCSGTVAVCAGGVWNCPYPGSYEVTETTCDSLDNDCNGVVDDPGVCGAPTEICDGLDNDADTLIDEGLIRSCGSNVGACIASTQDCIAGAWGPCTGAVGPSVEACDFIDNDCDGVVDEGNPGGGASCGPNIGQCVAGTNMCIAGAIVCQGVVGPSADVCDGIDNDCDGMVDEGNPGGGAACGIDVGQCVAGSVQCVGGTLLCTDVGPSPEACDFIDNDCDGLVDEGNPGGGAPCGTSTGQCSTGTQVCILGALQCEGAIGPTPEVCGDGLDNDCDGSIDNGCP